MKDQLGDRMKDQYEDRTRYCLPRRTYTVIRVDGKAFHTLTRGFTKPFDGDLMSIMDETAKRLCEEIQGARLAYVQSDEISILVTDFEKDDTCAWFDGNIQKITSISAAIASVSFNKNLLEKMKYYTEIDKFLDNKGNPKTGYFDSRVFTIPVYLLFQIQ